MARRRLVYEEEVWVRTSERCPDKHINTALWLFYRRGFTYWGNARGYYVYDGEHECSVEVELAPSAGGDDSPDVDCEWLVKTPAEAKKCYWDGHEEWINTARSVPGYAAKPTWNPSKLRYGDVIRLYTRDSKGNLFPTGPFPVTYQHYMFYHSDMTIVYEQGQDFDPYYEFNVFHSQTYEKGPQISRVRVKQDKEGIWRVIIFDSNGQPLTQLDDEYLKKSGEPVDLFQGYTPLLTVERVTEATDGKCERITIYGWLPQKDPLVFGLHGNGIQTTGTDEELHFDYDGDGFAELTGWVDSGAGVLFLDKNGNNKLDDGSELFGDDAILPDGTRAANGFGALAFYDANGDGMVDGSDPVWSELRMWEPELSDFGYTGDPHELGKISTLDELGIIAINLDYTDTNITDEAGNTEVRTGQFVWAGGSAGTFAEYSFDTDMNDTEVVEEWDVAPEISALPELHGAGTLRDLHQVMERDSGGELKALVEGFASETNADNRASIFTDLLFKWTGAESMVENLFGPHIDARRVKVLDMIFGGIIDNSGNQEMTALVAAQYNQVFHEIFELYYSDLMAQTHLKDLYDSITYREIDTAPGYEVDTTALVSKLQGALNEDYEQGKLLLSEFARSRRAFGYFDENCFLSLRETFIQQDPELGWVFDTGGLPVIYSLADSRYKYEIGGTFNSEAIRGSLTVGNGRLNGIGGADVIYGSDRDELLTKKLGEDNDILVGGGGNDRLQGWYGDDILDGGEGNDEIHGEFGNDTYIFRRGSGQDIVWEWDSTPDNVDTIWLGSNLTPDEVRLRRSRDDLVLSIRDADDTLTVSGFFELEIKRVEEIQFMDGTLWTYDDILREAFTPTEGDDIIYGVDTDDTISGAGGNDWIYGRGGHDTLRGDSGNDYLSGGVGNDTLEGGTGNDTLDGGLGDDTYVFNLGSGEDWIYDRDTTPGNIDTLEFGSGILPEDVQLRRVGSGLRVSVRDTGDSVSMAWLSDDAPLYGVELITFVDGTTWGFEEMQANSLKGSDQDDTIYGFSLSDTIHGQAGNDTIHGAKGNDVIEGGTGLDFLMGEAGCDTLTGGDGDDTLVGGEGADVLAGGAGNDSLFGGKHLTNWVHWDRDSGNDTYLFGVGSGHDTIMDHDRSSDNVDTIRLDAGIAEADIGLQRVRDALVLSIFDTNETLTVEKWFWNDSTEFRVEQIEFSDGTIWDADVIKQRVLLHGTSEDNFIIGYSTPDTIYGNGGDDTIYARGSDDTVYGGVGRDLIYGEGGNDTLNAGDGDDAVLGGAGHDTLAGGAGRDVLYGGDSHDPNRTGVSNGNDTFLFGRGSGQDMILDYDTTPGNVDAILFDSDILPADVSIRRNADHLVLSVEGTSDTLTVHNWFKDESSEWQVEEIRFGDGTTWNADTIKSQVLQGTPEDDELIGYSGSDTIEGLEGDDRISALGGNDTLEGGGGNDTLNGGTGDDTYLFGRGQGRDIIVDYDTTPGNVDTIQLAADVLPSDITVTVGGDHLFLSINNSDDRLQLSDWFKDDASKIERIQFADGTVWDSALIQQMVSTPSDTDDELMGTAGPDALDGGGGNDVIRGLAGDDTLFGGADHDELYGGEDNDRLVGGTGNDLLDGGTGVNTLEGGSGDDTIVAEEGRNTILVERGGFDTIYSRTNDGGTPFGTVMVKDIYPGSDWSEPTDLTNVNGTLFFRADDGVHGYELWKSDGTEDGTVMVKDIVPGAGSSEPRELTDVNGVLFFTAGDDIYGNELWRSDGTEDGTFMVRDILPGSGASWASDLTNVDGTLFFAAADGLYGKELWKSDGTEAGTVMVKDIRAGSDGSSASELTNVAGTLFFIASDGVNGRELWMSDGTEAGTVMVRDIYPGWTDSNANYLTELNGTLFFTADDGVNGPELWTSDGTFGYIQSDTESDTIVFGSGITPDEITVQVSIQESQSGGGGGTATATMSSFDSGTPGDLQLLIKDFLVSCRKHSLTRGSTGSRRLPGMERSPKRGCVMRAAA